MNGIAALGVPQQKSGVTDPHETTPPGTPGAAEEELGLTEKDYEEIDEEARKLGGQEKEGD